MIKLSKVLENILKEHFLHEEEKAYHGSSYYFKCFRAAGIGGGTGVQAYGWGLYFSKNIDIAKGYSLAGSNQGKKMLLFQGQTPEELGLKYECDVFFGLPPDLTTVEELIDYAEDMIAILKEEEDFEGKEDIIKDYEKFINIIQELDIEQEDMRYVYEVLLHKGKSPNQYEYLNWDERNTPQNQVDKINRQAEKENLDFKVNTSMSPSTIYHRIETYFGNNGYAQTSNMSPASKQTSLFLLRAGIDGNTHSDGQVRIIFDEKAISITNVCKVGKK
jgi:hypothetical protein